MKNYYQEGKNIVPLLEQMRNVKKDHWYDTFIEEGGEEYLIQMTSFLFAIGDMDYLFRKEHWYVVHEKEGVCMICAMSVENSVEHVKHQTICQGFEKNIHTLCEHIESTYEKERGHVKSK